MRNYILILMIAALSSGLFAQDVLDKIIAVVDNEIILKSELDVKVAITAAQRNIDPETEGFREQILQSLIDEKLLYAQAELDSVVVEDEQVDAQLDQTLNYYIQQYGSREVVEQTYGMSIEKIKREFRDDTRKNIMAQMVQQKKFGSIESSRREVEEFFTELSDSLGLIPERFHVAHIFMNPKTNDRVKKKARDLAQSIIDSLKGGADFAELAKAFSDDPGSAAQGGDLGWVKRGVFFPEFEAAAFQMREGELSGIVESPVGYHIIELLGRRGESINTRHVLVKIKSDDQTEIDAIQFLSDLRDSILAGDKDFAYYANKYSDDKQTAIFGGELGIFEVSQLDKSLRDIVYKMKSNEISFPKRLQIDRSTYGYHIVKLIERTPEHTPTLEDDYEDIKKLAEYNKKNELYKVWMEELRQRIYWEIRM